MGCVALVGCTKTDPAPAPTVEKKITYYAVIDGETKSIHKDMYKEDGKYPTKYVVGKGADIDDLVEYTENDFKYTFGGWFADEALNTAFVMNDKEANGDVSVYAKIIKTAIETAPDSVFADINYKAIIVNSKTNKVKEEIAIQNWMWDTSENAKYPLRYEEGVGATVSELKGKTEGYDSYAFVGWYMDKDFTEEFSGTISTDQKNAVTLYAKFVYTDLTPAEDEGAWTKNY